MKRTNTEGFITSNVKLVQDSKGNYYIALKPQAAYNKIRLVNRAISLVGLGSVYKLDVYSAVSYKDDGGYCGTPSFTSYDGESGLSLKVVDLQDQALYMAIDANAQTASLLKSTAVLSLDVAKAFSQYFYFNSKSKTNHTVNITLALG